MTRLRLVVRPWSNCKLENGLQSGFSTVICSLTEANVRGSGSTVLPARMTTKPALAQLVALLHLPKLSFVKNCQGANKKPLLSWRNGLKWENCSPLTPFLLNSFWLRPEAENSVRLAHCWRWSAAVRVPASAMRPVWHRLHGECGGRGWLGPTIDMVPSSPSSFGTQPSSMCIQVQWSAITFTPSLQESLHTVAYSQRPVSPDLVLIT